MSIDLKVRVFRACRHSAALRAPMQLHLHAQAQHQSVSSAKTIAGFVRKIRDGRSEMPRKTDRVFKAVARDLGPPFETSCFTRTPFKPSNNNSKPHQP